MLDPALAGLTAKAVTKVVDTDVGDKACQQAAKFTAEDDRHSHRSGYSHHRDSRHRREHQEHYQRRPEQQERSFDEDDKDYDRRSMTTADKIEKEKKEIKEFKRRSYWRSSRHQQVSSTAHEQPRAKPNEAPPKDWSRKSYWRRSKHQQQVVPKPDESDKQYEKRVETAARQAVMERERRCEEFREAKNGYVPQNANIRPQYSPRIWRTGGLEWDEERLYENVERAVSEAKRRSGETVRGAHW